MLVPGIDLIMGNDIAGDKVYPMLEAMPCGSETLPAIYPACVLTQARTRKWGEAVDVSDSILPTPLATDEPPPSPTDQKNVKPLSVHMPSIKLPVTRKQIIAAQKNDPTLAHCFDLAVSPVPV